MKEVDIDLGQGFKTTAWTFNGTIPGPALEVCVGDIVTLTVTNKGTMAHGLDSHAFQMDARKFGPIDPGKSLTITGTVKVPGVFTYHCAAAEITDQHIKMGMAGVMIVYPRRPSLPPAKELVVMRNGVYGTPSDKGVIASDSKAMERNAPTFFIFNGRLDRSPIAVKSGLRVRVYFVNAGPGVASFHVIGTILEEVPTRRSLGCGRGEFKAVRATTAADPPEHRRERDPRTCRAGSRPVPVGWVGRHAGRWGRSVRRPAGRSEKRSRGWRIGRGRETRFRNGDSASAVFPAGWVEARANYSGLTEAHDGAVSLVVMVIVAADLACASVAQDSTRRRPLRVPLVPVLVSVRPSKSVENGPREARSVPA